MHFIRKLLNLVSFRRPRANSVEPTEFRETSAGRICCSLECRYPAVSHPFSSFVLPRPNRQFFIFSFQNLGNSWIFLFSSDISFFSFFTRLPFASNAIDTSFQPGVFKWNKGFRFCCAVQRNEQRQPLFNVERVAEKKEVIGGY